MATAEKEMVTSQEAMHMLRISRPKLYQLIADGELTAPEKSMFASKRGRLVFDKEEVEKLIAKRKEELGLGTDAEANQGG